MMVGACFILENLYLPTKNLEEQKEGFDTFGPIEGQIMGTIGELCRKSFLYAGPRVVEGMYVCSLQLTIDFIGKVYAVIGKRRGKVSAVILSSDDSGGTTS